MGIKSVIKGMGCGIAHLAGVDSVLRFKYRKHLLVVMYHGVTRKQYSQPVWTQLPVSIFVKHIEWLAKQYHPVTLTEVVEAITHGNHLPERAVLVTFDDGLKNNATVAYPILKKYKVPAAIFLTVDFVGTDTFFWVDELWLLIQEAGNQQIDVRFNAQYANIYFKRGKYWEAYLAEVEYLKRISDKERLARIDAIHEQVKYNKIQYQDDFGMLAWRDVLAMDKDGLIEFGAHTATHRILTTIQPNELDDELFGAKERLEKQLGHSVDSFCYPNGKFGIDYLQEHKKQLNKGGYKCAFTTDLGLCEIEKTNAFSIPRVAAANDVLAASCFFQVDASGMCEYRKRYVQGIKKID